MTERKKIDKSFSAGYKTIERVKMLLTTHKLFGKVSKAKSQPPLHRKYKLKLIELAKSAVKLVS